jgi:hypothetical protein
LNPIEINLDDDEIEMNALWQRIVQRTGTNDLEEMKRISLAETSEWKLKKGKGTIEGSNYHILPTIKWEANEKIDDEVKRLTHLLYHEFYVGDENDKSNHQNTSTLQYLRSQRHNKRIEINSGTVDEFTTLLRLYDVKTTTRYYDPLPEDRAYHSVGESISIDQRRVLNIRHKNINPGILICNIIEQFDTDNFCAVAISFALQCMNHSIRTFETTKEQIAETKRAVNEFEKEFRVQPLIEFWKNLEDQFDSTGKIALSKIQTYLSTIRFDYFIDNLVKSNLIELSDGFVVKKGILF